MTHAEAMLKSQKLQNECWAALASGDEIRKKEALRKYMSFNPFLHLRGEREDD